MVHPGFEPGTSRAQDQCFTAGPSCQLICRTQNLPLVQCHVTRSNKSLPNDIDQSNTNVDGWTGKYCVITQYQLGWYFLQVWLYHMVSLPFASSQQQYIVTKYPLIKMNTSFRRFYFKNGLFKMYERAPLN